MSHTIEDIRKAKEEAQANITQIINHFESRFASCFMKEIIISRNQSIECRDFDKPIVHIVIQLPI